MVIWWGAALEIWGELAGVTSGIPSVSGEVLFAALQDRMVDQWITFTIQGAEAREGSWISCRKVLVYVVYQSIKCIERCRTLRRETFLIRNQLYVRYPLEMTQEDTKAQHIDMGRRKNENFASVNAAFVQVRLVHKRLNAPIGRSFQNSFLLSHASFRAIRSALQSDKSKPPSANHSGDDKSADHSYNAEPPPKASSILPRDIHVHAEQTRDEVHRHEYSCDERDLAEDFISMIPYSQIVNVELG